MEPTTKQEAISDLREGGSGFNAFGVAIFLVVVVEILLMFFLNLYEKSRVTKLSADLAAQQTELAKPENATLNEQISQVLAGQSNLRMALSSKTNWSSFLVQLNAVTPKNIKLTSLSISETGEFRADGQTSSLGSLAAALVAWRSGSTSVKTPFSSVSLASNSYVTNGNGRLVNFSITGQINLGAL